MDAHMPPLAAEKSPLSAEEIGALSRHIKIAASHQCGYYYDERCTRKETTPAMIEEALSAAIDALPLLREMLDGPYEVSTEVVHLFYTGMIPVNNNPHPELYKRMLPIVVEKLHTIAKLLPRGNEKDAHFANSLIGHICKAHPDIVPDGLFESCWRDLRVATDNKKVKRSGYLVDAVGIAYGNTSGKTRANIGHWLTRRLPSSESKNALTFNEWGDVLWHAMEGNVDRTRALLRTFLSEACALDSDALLQEWTRDIPYDDWRDYVRRAMAGVCRISHDRPGSPSLLHNEYGIMHFGRYDARLLTRQHDDERHVDESYVLSMSPHYDYNTAFANKHGYIASKLEDCLTRAEENLKRRLPMRFIEAGSKTELTKRLRGLRQKFSGKIDALILGGHGSPHSLSLGRNNDPDSVITSQDIRDGYLRQFNDIFHQDITIVMESCLTGTDGGLGQEISRDLQCHVQAPANSTYITRLLIGGSHICEQANVVAEYDDFFSSRRFRKGELYR